jgi:hypothetical protein
MLQEQIRTIGKCFTWALSHSLSSMSRDFLPPLASPTEHAHKAAWQHQAERRFREECYGQFRDACMKLPVVEYEALNALDMRASSRNSPVE